MAIATVDDIAIALSTAQRLGYLKILGAAKSAGAYQSSWLAAGRPGAGSAPPAFNAGSGYTCSAATPGAWPYSNGSVQNWLARVSGKGTQRGTIILADRLWSCSGMGFAASTYTVTTPGNLPARITDNGVGVEAWVENFVAAGAATGNLTLNYLNANTGAAKSGVITGVVSAPVAGQMQPIPLANGDTGVRQVTSAVTSATWTSGSFGITLLKRIAEIPLGTIGVATVMDWAQCLEPVPPDACLFAFYMAEVTTAATIEGMARVIDK